MAAKKKSSSGGGSRGRSSRVSSSKRNASRRGWRFVARLLAWLAILAVACFAAVLAAKGIRHAFFTGNPHFTLEEVEVNVTGRMTPEKVKKMLWQEWGVQPGSTNLFDVRPGRLRRGILDQKSGLIHDLTVERRLPDTLRICIYERRPAARLGRTNPLLIDGDGWILPARPTTRKENQYLLDLPVIVGIRDFDEYEPFQQARDPYLGAALRLLRLCATRSYGNWLDIQLIQLDYAADALHVFPAPRGCFVRGAQVVVPIDGMRSAVRRVEEIVRQRTRAQQTTSHINATYKINVPVRP